MVALAGCTGAPSALVGSGAALGAREHPRLVARFGGAVETRALDTYVAAVGERVHRASGAGGEPLNITILDHPEPNAFSLPGGYVYVTRGLLALVNAEDELAGVLAHEIAHVNERHALERLDRARRIEAAAVLDDVLDASSAPSTTADTPMSADVLAGVASVQQFSREQEFEADRLAVGYLDAAGYDPAAMARVLRALTAYDAFRPERPRAAGSPLATHPLLADRVTVAATAAEAVDGQVGPSDRTRLLDAIDGLTFGPNPNVGFIVARRFIHPALGFRFALPTGFRVAIEDEQVLGRNADGLLLVLDAMGDDVDTALVRLVQQRFGDDVDPQHVDHVVGNGLEMATATGTLELDGRPAVALAAFVRHPQHAIYRIRFVKPGEFTPTDRHHIRTVLASFSLMSPGEIDAFAPRQIEVVTVDPGDDVATLASRMDVGSQKETLFRLLNGLADGSEVKPGDRVKLVRPVDDDVAQTTRRASNPSSS